MGPKNLFHSLSQKLLAVLAALVLMFGALPVLPSYAAGSIAVNTTVDENTSNGSCSLREAIIAANNNAAYNGCIYSGTGPDDVITLQSGTTYPLTITGLGSETGDLDIGNAGGTSGNLTIMANGGTNAIIDASAIVNRVIEVGAPGDTSLTLDHITVMNGQISTGAGILFGGNGTLTLNNSTVSTNTADSAQNCGAGIFNNTSANINIIGSTIEGNTCTGLNADGGGLFKGTGGTLTVTNSTFNNNTAPDDGGGIRLLLVSGTVTITNSTFANNTAARGGGIQVEGGTVTIAFSTFSGNAANITPGPNTGGAVQAAAGTVQIANSILANSTTNAAVGKDCDQAVPGTVNLTSSLVENNNDCTGTGNLSADPQLGSLQNNGGPTKTMAFVASSPAINAASDAGCPITDQRGITRPQGSHCDIGAYELDSIPAPQLLSILRQDPAVSTTNADVLVFRVSFSKTVINVNGSDFKVTGPSSVNKNVNPINGSTYDVTVSGGNLAGFNGIVGLDLDSSQDITDSFGVSLPTQEPGVDETYTLENSFPGVIAIQRVNASPTAASSVAFTVTFSEAVTGVDTSAPFADFSLFTSGITGASISGVTGSGASYTVSVNTGTGNGKIRLDVPVSATVQNLDGSPLAGVPFTSGQSYTVLKTPTFTDVPTTHPYWQDIEVLYANGLTGGCATNPLKFCPDQIMDRAQAAVFMVRGAYGSGYAPNPSANLFQDNWTPGTWARPWAEAMRETGLTTGCQLTPLLYCPWQKLPREQAMIFALKMRYGNGYQPPAATGTVFADMTDPNYYATPWAEQAYADGLIQSCGTSGGKPMICPTTLVTRGLGAYMIVRAKNLTMP